MSRQSRKETKSILHSLELGAVLALLAIGCFLAKAQDLPNAPAASKRVETAFQRDIRYSLLGEIALGRTADWISTQQCMRTPGCREAELPQAIAKSKPGLAVFELGMTGLEIWGSNKLARKHPKLAIFADTLSMVSVTATVGHNYSVIESVHRPSASTQFVRITK